MKVEKLSKERLGTKVLFPRTQLAGLSCDDKKLLPQFQDFDVELLHDVPNMGTVKLIFQQQPPHMWFQLFETDSVEKFDDYLGTSLGMYEIPSYISGCTDFLVFFQGARDHIEVTQTNYNDIVRLIRETKDAATRWWYEYGKETLLLKNVEND